MASFKVGDRVRSVTEQSMHRGREATVIEVRYNSWLTDYNGRQITLPVVCCVDVDGVGRIAAGSKPKQQLGFAPYELAPLTPPAEDAWASEQVRKVTKPIHVEPVAPVRVPVQ